MSVCSIEFGYHPSSLQFRVGQISVEPLFNFKDTVAGVAEWDGVEGDWIFAPMQRVCSFNGETHERPYSSRIFGLPKTHKLTHPAADNKEHLNFHVWTLSFFEGIRLTTAEAGFLDATPLRPGKLVDFMLRGNSRRKAVGLAEQFWSTHRTDPLRARWFTAAVHALFLGQNPRHLQFEEFMLLYTAFDACYALASSLYPTRRRIPHAQRVKWMCDLFDMTTPNWAVPAAPLGPEAITLRNTMFHEALFLNEPLGFALHGLNTNRNLTLEMKALISRLLVALIGGGQADYIRSPINTRQMYILDLS